MGPTAWGFEPLRGRRSAAARRDVSYLGSAFRLAVHKLLVPLPLSRRGPADLAGWGPVRLGMSHTNKGTWRRTTWKYGIKNRGAVCGLLAIHTARFVVPAVRQPPKKGVQGSAPTGEVEESPIALSSGFEAFSKAPSIIGWHGPIYRDRLRAPASQITQKHHREDGNESAPE